MVAGKKSLEQKVKNFCMSFKRLNLSPELAQEFKNEVHKALDEAEELEKKIPSKLEKELDHFHSQNELLIPDCLTKKTFREINSEGGEFYYDGELDCLVLIVPRKIMLTETKSSSKLPPSLATNQRFILGDASSAVNKLQLSVVKSKRHRIIAPTPSHTMTTRKKQDRLSRYSSNPCDSSMIYPTASLRSAVKPAVTSTVTKSRLRAPGTVRKAPARTLPGKPFQFKAPAPVAFDAKRTPMKMEAISPIFNDSIFDESTRLTNINPKTPGGKNRLFKKAPRLAKEDDVIIHCSVSGTPLIVDSDRRTRKN